MALTLFHTAESNVELFSKLFTEIAPGIPILHHVDPEPLSRAVNAGRLTPEVAALAQQRILAAIRPETRVLVCTCSTLGQAVDDMTHLWVPLLRIDRPMAEHAVTFGNRILIAACLESTIEPTRALVQSASYDRDNWEDSFTIETLRIFDAWALFQAGDRNAYWNRIAERLRESAGGFDAVVLAQASMAGAALLLGDLGIPVLSSPRIGVESVAAFYYSWLNRAPTLTDELARLLDQYGQPGLERVVLKMALCLAEQIDHRGWDGWRRVRLNREEYQQTPGQFELLNGVLHDRHGWPPQDPKNS